jgi:hypothetical protein
MRPPIHQKIIPHHPATDIWQCGIVHQPIATLLAPNALLKARITWLPEPGNFRFIADPFALQHDGRTTVFVEAYDYRTKHGRIDYYSYDASYRLLMQGIALQTPFHLSYPFLIEDGSDVYMLPEASKNGKVTLYRAVHFPDQWEPVTALIDVPAIDASIIQKDDKWWMFYTLPGEDNRPLRELYVAYADRLMGPWTMHSGNPVRTGLESSRPGGTPFHHEGQLYLPTQDCRKSYGDAITMLRIDTLTPTTFAATPITRLSPDGVYFAYPDGLHTLSACGDVTLIDLKRVDYSRHRKWINLERRIRRLLPI